MSGVSYCLPPCGLPGWMQRSFYRACGPLQVSDSKPVFTASVRSPHRRPPSGQAKILHYSQLPVPARVQTGSLVFPLMSTTAFICLFLFWPLGSLVEWVSWGESLECHWPLGPHRQQMPQPERPHRGRPNREHCAAVRMTWLIYGSVNRGSFWPST